MPIYSYTALSASGTVMHGEEAAPSAEDVRRALSAKGLLVQAVQPKRGTFGLRRQRVKPPEFLLFNQEFIALLRAGLTIPEALKLAAHRPEQPALARILEKVLTDVQGGALLSEACAQHPEAFEGLYLSALRTGEKTGALPAVLAKYQEYLKNQVELRKKISHALAYPLFLMIALGLALAVLFVFVLPRFVSMYTDVGAELPMATRILINAVRHAPIYLPLLIGAGVLAWLGLRPILRRPAGRLWLDGIKEKLPLLGAAYRDIAIGQVARTLSTLLSGGTPLVEAMSTTCASLTSSVYAQRLAAATQRVTGGQSLAQAMQETGILPGTAVKMVEVGEASGGLDTMLGQIALFYEDSLNNKLARIMVLIEPMLMLVMGLLIGGTIIIMYLPIFSLVDVIQ